MRVIVIVTEEAPVTKSKKSAHTHTMSDIGKNKKLNNLPDVFYTPIKKNKYHKFNREDIYNR